MYVDCTPKETSRRYVVVHGGARDNYQVALALHEAGLLKTLVTDLSVPQDTVPRWHRWMPNRMRALSTARAIPLESGYVHNCALTGLLATVLERFRFVPFSLRRVARRLSDASLGRTAGRLAAGTGSELLAYSYFGAPAFRALGSPALLFQVHPHPLTTRRLLQEERAMHPQCAESLDQEWELALPERDLQHLIHESGAARAYLVASSFTRDSLVEHGVPPQRIQVVPYGVDLERFRPCAASHTRSKVLQLLFVGRINQRKGLLYLLQALALLQETPVHLTICGRVVDDLSLFKPFADRVTIRPSVSSAELVAAYQQADLFVFPSVVEGFGQVLLEALASGLPIVATTHTAAPDLIQDGIQGWIVAPRSAEQLADRIRWASEHRDTLQCMADAARERAKEFTWQRFREGVVRFVNANAAPRLAPTPAVELAQL